MLSACYIPRTWLSIRHRRHFISRKGETKRSLVFTLKSPTVTALATEHFTVYKVLILSHPTARTHCDIVKRVIIIL